MLSGKVVGALLSIVYLGLATRSLGPEAFGQFAMVLSIGQGVSSLVSFESWQLLVRYGMDRLEPGHETALGRLFAFCVVLDVIGAAVGALAVTTAVFVLAPAFGWSGDLTRDALLFCFVLLMSTRSAATGVLRLHDRFGAAALVETAIPVLRFVGALAVVASGATIERLLAAWAAAEILTALLYWTKATRIIRPQAQWWRLSSLRAIPTELPGILGYAGLVNATSTLRVAGRQLPVLLVGGIVGPASAGLYRVAFQLAQALANVSEMTSRAVFAELMRAQSDRSPSELASLFRRAALLALGTAVIIAVVVLTLGEPMIALLAGPAFAGAYPLLLFLGIAAALDAAGVAFEPALVATERAGLAFGLRAVATAVLVGLLVLLLRPYGAPGAAAATMLGSMTAMLLLGWAAWRTIHARS